MIETSKLVAAIHETLNAEIGKLQLGELYNEEAFDAGLRDVARNVAQAVLLSLEPVSLPSDADLAALRGLDLGGAAIDAAAVLRAMFPRSTSVAAYWHGVGDAVEVQVGSDDDLIAAANRLNARVRKVSHDGRTWLDATLQVGRTLITAMGPHHKLAEPNPDGPNIDFILPAWRPTDPAVSP